MREAPHINAGEPRVESKPGPGRILGGPGRGRYRQCLGCIVYAMLRHSPAPALANLRVRRWAAEIHYDGEKASLDIRTFDGQPETGTLLTTSTSPGSATVSNVGSTGFGAGGDHGPGALPVTELFEQLAVLAEVLLVEAPEAGDELGDVLHVAASCR